MQTEKFTMPFTGHDPEELAAVLGWLKDSPPPVECFDAFLDEYVRTKSLGKSQFRAQCEWDC